MVDTNDKMESVTIILPMPPNVLSPNGQHGHWRPRAIALKRCRKLAREAVENEAIDTTWMRVKVQAIFYHKTKRRRDGANFNSMLKGYFDGIVDAGLVVDDDSEHWTTLPPMFRIDPEQNRVEIVIENCS